MLICGDEFTNWLHREIFFLIKYVTGYKLFIYTSTRWSNGQRMLLWKAWAKKQPKLREKCPKTEFFLIRIFPHSGWTKYLSVFSPNAGKYGPEKTLYLYTIHAVQWCYYRWILENFVYYQHKNYRIKKRWRVVIWIMQLLHNRWISNC